MADAALSKACCSLPAIVAEGYQPKGEYSNFNGTKTYITGAKDSKVALLFVYDAFGFANQTLQGADILAQALNAIVVMPDFLEGGFPLDFFPPDTPEKQKMLGDFFSENGLGNFERGKRVVNESANAIKETYPSAEKVVAFGLCWGGKVVILANNDPSSIIVASGQTHPARLAKEDAAALRVPHLVLASKDEDPADVKAFDEVKKPEGSETHTYSTMFHGWMGARANLKDQENLKEYQSGYQQTANWFKKVLAAKA